MSWLTTAGVFASGATLGGGTIVAIIQGIFRRNDSEAKANAAKILTDAAGELVKQWQKTNDELRESNEELKTSNKALQKDIIRVRAAMLSLTDAVDRVVPLLNAENSELHALHAALNAARASIV